ncbi:MAG: flavin oxidoreductase [Flavobacterium sp. BFFFF2]|nr:MAG: flavin oxidoreductase [Flavobacterium sp. BFFFF2]
MTAITTKDISQMESRFRAALLNSISGFKSASLIGSIDTSGQTNLAVFSSVVHLGSNPPLMGFICRPDSTDRHTLSNILETKTYTINHIHAGIYAAAHQTAARYPKNISEFEATGLTPEFIGTCKAPFVQQSHIKYGLSFAEKHDLTINGTILVIGKVEEIIFPTDCLLPNGALDIEKAETLAISGLDSYHNTQLVARLSYAKPDSWPKDIRD